MTPVSFSSNISVLLPIFVDEPSSKILHQLSRALTSVIDQHYPGQMEIVIIDDGSIQPIEDMMRQAKLCTPSNLRIIRSKRNNGLVHALNLGLRAAKHDLIARIDADDAWLPGKIEQQRSRFAVEPDLSIIATGMIMSFEDGSPPETHLRPDGWDAILHFAADVGCPFPHGSVLARKDIYRLLGGYSHSPDVAHCEDYALWSLWLRFFQPAMIEQALYAHTVSTSSISYVHSEQQRRASQRISSYLRGLELSGIAPSNLADLAKSLNITLLQAGVLCYRLWHYRLATTLPAEALDPLRKVLPDRNVRLGLSPGRQAIDKVALLNGFGAADLFRSSANSIVITVD